ncbi:MAG: 3-isopropylmalate dehydratase small subunit [Roseibacillus sp.]|nr:3-isopropylmalate dehydratase small subunit [Verrucomicrobiota bacterium]NRB26540.1 3-isopropylmalate dehydratase small subunit [Roseibacillus sp.]HAT20431.1 3-isopropylmalate dehydratase small subunit [Verrucomicrobiales bacterium]
MALDKITSITGTAVHLPGADIDTDRIIPARYLKCVTFDDLADKHFHDVRYDPEGNATGHPLDDPRFKGASIMLSGPNFGCGSSREHAPQAIYRSGFRAIIAESFAEIFFGNSTTLGMPCLSASREDIDALGAVIGNAPATEVTIDLEAMEVTCGETRFAITMPGSARHALTAGRWDPIQELLDNEGQITAAGEALPYV